MSLIVHSLNFAVHKRLSRGPAALKELDKTSRCGVQRDQQGQLLWGTGTKSASTTLPCAGTAVLRGVVQDLLELFQAQLPSQLMLRPAPARQDSKLMQGSQQAAAGWQGRAASAVVALTEVMYGASASWQDTQQSTTSGLDQSPHSAGTSLPVSEQDRETSKPHQCSTAKASPTGPTINSHSVAKKSSSSSGSRNSSSCVDGSSRQDDDIHTSSPNQSENADGHGLTQQLEQIVLQVLDDFSCGGVWALATHVDSDAAVPATASLTPQV